MTQPPPFGGQWTAPPPPVTPGDRPIRGGRVTLGVALAIAGHLVTIAIVVAGAYADNQNIGTWVTVALAGQLLVFVLCLVFGILNLARWDRGLGLGLLVGWAAGVIVLPVIGFGVCVVIVNSLGPV